MEPFAVDGFSSLLSAFFYVYLRLINLVSFCRETPVLRESNRSLAVAAQYEVP